MITPQEIDLAFQRIMLAWQLPPGFAKDAQPTRKEMLVCVSIRLGQIFGERAEDEVKWLNKPHRYLTNMTPHRAIVDYGDVGLARVYALLVGAADLDASHELH